MVTTIIGMHGMGDNLHQRAIVREMVQHSVVHLETPWPSIYHDLQGRNLKLVKKPTALRTQAKNIVREADKYDVVQRTAFGGRQIRIWYTGKDVQQAGSVLGAMCANARVGERNFSMPVPDEWRRAAGSFLRGWNDKPLLVYRPLIMRTEWGGCAARNPLVDQYYELIRSIRDRFYVVSVADLVQGVEWRVDRDIDADLELHHGELSFEALAGLFSRASLVYASPGFAVPLAQAVGTPVVCVFGGYENSSSFTGGAALAPYLGIDPVIPCGCFSHTHACSKIINVPQAQGRLQQFVDKYADTPRAREANSGQLELPLEAVHESRRVGNADHAGRVGAAQSGVGIRDQHWSDGASNLGVRTGD
jgi:hypothetical protein